ncbi:MAG: hypothetical protein EBW38_19865 [Rhodobacteraceae bacterium]|nr:hypothetical protein [Paracoccaceae bacterium]
MNCVPKTEFALNFGNKKPLARSTDGSDTRTQGVYATGNPRINSFALRYVTVFFFLSCIASAATSSQRGVFDALQTLQVDARTALNFEYLSPSLLTSAALISRYFSTTCLTASIMPSALSRDKSAKFP